MENIDLINQEIEILFENCECIIIDMWAIRTLIFDTDGDTYTWDRSHKDLLKKTRLKYFKLTVDLDDTRYFHHTNRLIDTKTIEEDGAQCINRLIHSDDITDLYINGTCFNIPWIQEKYTGYIAGSPINLYRNEAQINSELTDTSGTHTLTIYVDVRDKEKSKKIREGQAATDITEAEAEADE